MKEGLAVVLVIVLLIALIFGISAVALVHYQTFAPWQQSVDRQVFEATPSFVEGKEQTLAELRLEYNKAQSAGERSNVRSMIVNEAAAVDINKFKDHTLTRFVEALRNN